MFKLETFVKPMTIFCCLMCLVVFSTQSFGDDDDAKPDPQKSYETAKKWANDRGLKGDAREKFIEKKMQEWMGGNQDTCKEAQTKFSTAQSEFSTACSNAGMSGGSTFGSIACSDKISDCTDAQQIESTLDEDSSEAYDVEKMREQSNKCPAIAAKDLKTIKEDLKSTREEIKDLNEKIPELQQDQKEQTAAAQDKVNDATEQLQEQQKQCREDQKSLQRNLKDAEKSIQDQVQQLNSQLLSLNDQLGQAENAKVSAAFKYAQAKAAIEDACHKNALEKVNAKRKMILEKVAASTYNVGDMSAAIAKAGVTSRKRDQQMAFQEYKWCMNDASTMRQFKLAQEAYNVAEDAYKKQVTTLKAQMQQTQQQIGVLANNETTRARVENAEDLRDLQVSCTQSIALAQQRLSQAQMNAMSSSVSGILGMPGAQSQQTDALTQAKQDLALAKEREKNIVQAYRMASAGSGNGESNSFFTALNKANELESAAEGVYMQCCDANDITGAASVCTRVKNYLASIGKSTDPVKSSPVDVASADRPTASETTTTGGSTNATGSRTPSGGGSGSGTQPVHLPGNGDDIPIPTPASR